MAEKIEAYKSERGQVFETYREARDQDFIDDIYDLKRKLYLGMHSDSISVSSLVTYRKEFYNLLRKHTLEVELAGDK